MGHKTTSDGAYICPSVRLSVCLSICPFVRLSVRPHGITVGVYIRIHFWDALLIKFVKILGLELDSAGILLF